MNRFENPKNIPKKMFMFGEMALRELSQSCKSTYVLVIFCHILNSEYYVSGGLLSHKNMHSELYRIKFKTIIYKDINGFKDSLLLNKR